MGGEHRWQPRPSQTGEQVSAQQCQQGANSPHAGNQFHRQRERERERRRTWKEAYWRQTEILHLELLDLVPRFFFFSLLSICKLGDPVKWSCQEPDQEPAAKEKRLLWILL